MTVSNVEVLKTLRSAPDFPALKDIVQKMCGSDGPATSYQLIFHSDGRSVSCLLEMKHPLLDAEMRECDAYGFGNIACLDFNVGIAPDGDDDMSSEESTGGESLPGAQLAMAA